MQYSQQDENSFIRKIADRNITIYDHIENNDPDLWLSNDVLESLLRKGLVGLSLKGLPLKTRSKVFKQAVCTALGYPIPQSFRKTKPQFIGQSFDTYVQKSNNLQIWNEAIFPTRRYAIFHLNQYLRQLLA